MEEEVKRCISTTNSVIQKWKLRKLNITEEDVNQILLGYLRKWVSKNKMNFKQLKRRIIVHMDFKTKYINDIRIPIEDILKQSYQSQSDMQIRRCAEIIETINYESLIPSDLPIEVLEINYPQQISFESIKNIKF